MSPEATSTLYSPLTKPWAPAPTTRSTAAIGTIEGISALGGNGTQPSLPQPVGGGLSSADATEYSMVGGWLERLEAIHHLPSRRMIVRDCEPNGPSQGSPTLM